jgi:hypothetical protein
MSAILRLPPELIQFSLRDPPRSLLIRGEPGAGKSTLALTMLSAFRGKRVLVTSRLTKSEVEQDYPWLSSEVEGSVEVIESLSGGAGMAAKARALRGSHELVRAETDEPELEQLWLPDPVIGAFASMAPGAPGMVVIDSWDALIEHYIGSARAGGGQLPDREEIERLMLGLLRRGGAHLVLVVERERPSQLDYLVDGVVACVLTSSEDRLERWSHLKKLRGVRVDHPWYPYTLEGGRFLCIAPIPSGFRSHLHAPEAEPEPHAGLLWPGSTAWATQFGRLPLGHVTLIESDPDVPVEAVRLLLSPIQAQALAGGGRVLVVLPPSLSPADVWDSFRTVLSPDAFAANVRISSTGGLASTSDDFELLQKVMVPGPSGTGPATSTRMPEAVQFLRERGATGAPNLSTVWLNGLHAETPGGGSPYAPDTLPAIVQQTLAGAGSHLVMIGAPTDPFLVALQEIASTRIALKARSGRVFVYGLRPVTPPLVLAQSDAGSMYHLIRIV